MIALQPIIDRLVALAPGLRSVQGAAELSAAINFATSPLRPQLSHKSIRYALISRSVFARIAAWMSGSVAAACCVGCDKVANLDHAVLADRHTIESLKRNGKSELSEYFPSVAKAPSTLVISRKNV